MISKQKVRKFARIRLQKKKKERKKERKSIGLLKLGRIGKVKISKSRPCLKC